MEEAVGWDIRFVVQRNFSYMGKNSQLMIIIKYEQKTNTNGICFGYGLGD